MINKIKKHSGFTILESIVAIGILSLSIAGAFSAIQTSLFEASIAKDEVKAFYLAQEATEVIRNKRDTNKLAIMNGGGGTSLDSIKSACPVGHTCTVDARDFSIYDCGIGSWGTCSQYLKQDTQGANPTYLYNYTTGPDTNFKREIQIESLLGGDEIAVTVNISYPKGSFKVKAYLFNSI